MSWELKIKGGYVYVLTGKDRVIAPMLRVKNPPVFRRGRFGYGWDDEVSFTDFYDYERQRFPSGFLDKVAAKLEKRGYHLIIYNAVHDINLTKLTEDYCHQHTARGYQLAAARIALERRCGVLEIGTGGGKTFIMALMVGFLTREYHKRCLILVPGKGLLHQTYNEIKKFVGDDISVGRIGDGRKELDCQITVGLPSTLIQGVPPTHLQRAPKFAREPKNPALHKFLRKQDVLIIDECHGTGAETWYKVAMTCKAKVRYGFSGTPKTGNALRDARLEAVCGPIIFRKTSADLVNDGFLAEPILYFLADPSIYEKVDHIPPEPENYRHAYTEGIVKNRKYHRYAAKLISAFVKGGRQVIVSVRRLAHLRAICKRLQKKGISYARVSGSTPAVERERLNQQFKNRQVNVMVGTSVLDMGIDLPQADALLLLGGEKAQVGIKQRIGRVLRNAPGKENAIIVDFSHDSHFFMLRHASMRAKLYKKEGIRVITVDDKDELLRIAKRAQTNLKRKSS